MDVLNFKNFRNFDYQNSVTGTPFATKDASASADFCKTTLEYICPQFSSQTLQVTDSGKISLRTKYKIKPIKVGTEIVLHSETYGTKLYVVEKVALMSGNGAVYVVVGDYIDTGEKNSKGIPNDTKKAWVSCCPKDVQAFKDGTLFGEAPVDETDGTGNETDSSNNETEKKKQSPLAIILIVAFVVIITALYFRRKNKKINK